MTVRLNGCLVTDCRPMSALVDTDTWFNTYLATPQGVKCLVTVYRYQPGMLLDIASIDGKTFRVVRAHG